MEKIQEDLSANRLYSTFNPQTNRIRVAKYDDDAQAYSLDLLFHPAIAGQHALDRANQGRYFTIGIKSIFSRAAS